MDSLCTSIVSAAKLPILNLNEFDLWKIRIEQYFLMTDYSLWEVIINGDSPAPTVVVDGVVQPVTIISADQKLAKRNKLKARGTLLIALPDKHQLKINSHKDAKTLMEAIEKRFGGNTKTKKVQKTLLKQQFENFTGSSSENLDQIHDRLQKLVSQLQIHGMSLSQEDVNLKCLHSLPSEWKTYTLIWRNKANLEEHSLDDLFNSLKIYETKVRHSSSPGNSTQNLAFVSSSNTDNTTDSVSAATSVSTICAKLPVSSYPNIDSLSNAVIFSFFASQSTSPQLDNEDLKQIDKIGRNLGDNRVTTMGVDMSKLKCYNCHRKGHFIKECMSPKDTRRTGAAELQRRNALVETSTSNALVFQCDGIRSYDWSYQAEEEPANFALMDITSSSSSSDNEVQSCSKACSKAYDQLHSQYDKMTVEFRKSQIDVLSYQADESKPNDPQSVPSLVQTFKHVKPPRHSVQPVEAPILATTPKPTGPKTNSSGKRKNRKTCFVCRSVDHLIKDCNFHAKLKAQPTPKNYAHRGYNKKNASFTQKHPKKHIVPAIVLTKSKLVSVTAVRPVSAAVPKIMMNRPKHAHSIDKKSKSTFRRHITRSQSLKTSNSPSIVTATKASVAKAVNTACYVQNRVLVTKPHNKTPYELLHGRTPSIGFMRPFGCPVTILNTLDPLGKFEGKVDEGFLVGYSVNSTGPTWLFDIDSLTRTMNYQPVTAGNQSNPSTGFQGEFDAEKAREEANQQYMLFPVWSTGSSNPYNKEGDVAFDGKEHDAEKPEFAINLSPSSRNRELNADFKDYSEDSGNDVSVAGPIVPTVGQNYSNSTNPFSAAAHSNTNTNPTHGKPLLKVASQLFDNSDMLEMEDIAYSDHENVVTEADINNLETSIIVYKNKKDERGIVVRNKARLVTQGHTQEEGIDYEEVFAPVARIEAIRLFLAYASFMGFMMYQMDVKSAFLYETIEEEVYVYQPLRFEDPDHPDKVYKVVKTLYGLHQAPRAWYETLANYLLENGFHRGQIDQTLFIKKQKGYILLMGTHILFGSSGKSGSTPIDKEKPLLKDPDGEDVDVHIYRSMIGSLMYLTSSRPNIMFAVCACARFQVTPKALHLHAVKRIFRYPKDKPLLGLWYPKDSPFDLVAYSDSDYAEAEYVAGASCCAQVLWIQNQILDYGSPCYSKIKSWLVQKQMALGKDKSNPLTVDSLLETIWSSIHHLLTNEVLTIPGQTATGISYCCSVLRIGAARLVMLGHQFWNTVAVKQSNDVTRLQALVDKKKVVVTEAAIRDTLCLDDAEGVDCLPNEEIFTELDRMGYEKPSTKLTFYKAFFSSQWKFLIYTILQSMSAKRSLWNEFSLTMASAMICLSTSHKFNFCMYIFDRLVRNVDSSSKFYMYPRFIHLIIHNQLGDLSTHTTKYISPALTQKVFANIRRVGKRCSRVETPLFEGMLVAREPAEQGDAEEQSTDDNAAEEPDTAVSEDNVKNQSIPSPTPPTPPPQQPQDIPSTSQAQSPPPQP
nr:hypothetical protein [Tanacetum cinerariifolium]